MSSSLRITATSNSLRPSFHKQPQVGNSRHSALSLSPLLSLLTPVINHHNTRNQHSPVHSISAGDNTAYGISDSQSSSGEPKGSTGSDNSQHGGLLSTTKILEQLKRYGVAGILSYGLLNTIYYLTAFLVVWFYFAPVPGKMGYLAAATRFLKVMAMVWAGSQVTKLIRAAGALALAPFVDRGLAWFTVRFNFESRGKAFFTIVGFCLGLAIIMFLVVTLLWA